MNKHNVSPIFYIYMCILCARTVVYYSAPKCDFLNVCNGFYADVNEDYTVKDLVCCDGFICFSPLETITNSLIIFNVSPLYHQDHAHTTSQFNNYLNKLNNKM